MCYIVPPKNKQQVAVGGLYNMAVKKANFVVVPVGLH